MSSYNGIMEVRVLMARWCCCFPKKMCIPIQNYRTNNFKNNLKRPLGLIPAENRAHCKCLLQNRVLLNTLQFLFSQRPFLKNYTGPGHWGPDIRQFNCSEIILVCMNSSASVKGLNNSRSGHHHAPHFSLNKWSHLHISCFVDC